ncbi:MAG: IS21-like element helper ATPase IstB [Actinomycetota bacterium]
MLTEATIDRLNAMKLHGMAEGFRRWCEQGDRGIEAADLLGMLADAEWSARENKKLSHRLRRAKFRLSAACIEDVDYRPTRGLAKSRVLELATSRWITEKRNLIVTGATGTGKSYLACALGQKACRDGHTVLYLRPSRLFDLLYQAHGDGTYRRVLARIARTQLLIIDDFALEPLDAEARRNLLEILEDRYGASSTLVTSQLDPKNWHGVIGDATIADAVLDRLVHNAERIKLAGESLRRIQPSGSGRKEGATSRK